MEFLSTQWFLSLLSIVLVDLLLAGDNAIVIALAARNLPSRLQRQAIIYGTLLAIAVRVLLTFFVTFLLKIPGLGAIGGSILYFIAWRLVDEDQKRDENGKVANNFFEAMMIIVIADTVMGLDNVLAIAGAARGDLGLIIIGLALSIPIMMGGSVIILRFFEKMPWLVIVGSALLSCIAGRIILDDAWVRENVDLTPPAEWLLIVAVAFGVTVLAWATLRTRRRRRLKS